MPKGVAVAREWRQCPVCLDRFECAASSAGATCGAKKCMAEHRSRTSRKNADIARMKKAEGKPYLTDGFRSDLQNYTDDEAYRRLEARWDAERETIRTTATPCCPCGSKVSEGSTHCHSCRRRLR